MLFQSFPSLSCHVGNLILEAREIRIQCQFAIGDKHYRVSIVRLSCLLLVANSLALKSRFYLVSRKRCVCAKQRHTKAEPVKAHAFKGYLEMLGSIADSDTLRHTLVIPILYRCTASNGCLYFLDIFIEELQLFLYKKGTSKSARDPAATKYRALSSIS